MATSLVSCMAFQGARAAEVSEWFRGAKALSRGHDWNQVALLLSPRARERHVLNRLGRELVALRDRSRREVGTEGTALWLEVCDPYEMVAFIEMQLKAALAPRSVLDIGYTAMLMSQRRFIDAEPRLKALLRRKHWSWQYIRWSARMLLMAIEDAKILKKSVFLVTVECVGATRHEAYRVK